MIPQGPSGLIVEEGRGWPGITRSMFFGQDARLATRVFAELARFCRSRLPIAVRPRIHRRAIRPRYRRRDRPRAAALLRVCAAQCRRETRHRCRVRRRASQRSDGGSRDRCDGHRCRHRGVVRNDRAPASRLSAPHAGRDRARACQGPRADCAVWRRLHEDPAAGARRHRRAAQLGRAGRRQLVVDQPA